MNGFRCFGSRRKYGEEEVLLSWRDNTNDECRVHVDLMLQCSLTDYDECDPGKECRKEGWIGRQVVERKLFRSQDGGDEFEIPS